MDTTPVTTDEPARKGLAEAYATQTRDDAIRRYPQLISAYEVQDAMALSVRTILQTESRVAQQFEAQTRQTIAEDLRAGKVVELRPEFQEALYELRQAEAVSRTATRDDAQARALIREAESSGFPAAVAAARGVDRERASERSRESLER